jgi:selenophosphate synthase
LADFNPPTHPDLLVDIKTKDDAGVYRLNEEQAIIQTLDFFTPMVDDPYLFGQIGNWEIPLINGNIHFIH